MLQQSSSMANNRNQYPLSVSIKMKGSRRIADFVQHFYCEEVMFQYMDSSYMTFQQHVMFYNFHNTRKRCHLKKQIPVGTAVTSNVKRTTVEKFREHFRPGSLIRRLNLWFLLVIIFVCIIIAKLGVSENKCLAVFDTEHLGNFLEDNFIGQRKILKGIKDVVSTLNASLNTDFKTLTLIGHSGVGKTYLASLLSKEFPWKENVCYLSLPIHLDLLPDGIDDRLSSCGYNLLVVDNLKPHNVILALQLIRKYRLLSEQMTLKIILLLIFNENSKTISSKLNQTSSEHKDWFKLLKIPDHELHYFQFEELKKSDIMKCVEKSLLHQGVQFDRTSYDLFMKTFMRHSNLYDGCKRINKKVAIFVEKYKLL